MTKLGVFPQLLLKSTTGLWKLQVQDNKFIRIKPSVIKPGYSEDDLLDSGRQDLRRYDDV
eukprot:8740396-Pyramimonas_sp.AAC.1